MSTTAAQTSSGFEIVNSSAGASRKTAAIDGSRARPDQRATVATASSTATDCIEHDRGEAHRSEPRRLRHLIARQPGWRPLAVEAFEGTQHGPTDGLRQPQPLRQVCADLTVRPGRLLDDLGHPGSAGQHAQLLDARAQTRQEPQRLQGPRRVDQIPARADGDVIATEGRGRLVRGGRAPRVPHQARVEDLSLPSRRQPGPARQFCRQQACAHRLTGRVAAGQVTGHRQRRDHSGETNLPGHQLSLEVSSGCAATSPGRVRIAHLVAD